MIDLKASTRKVTDSNAVQILFHLPVIVTPRAWTLVDGAAHIASGHRRRGKQPAG